MIGVKLSRTLRLAAAGLASWVFFSSAAQADVDVGSAKIRLIGIDPRFQGPMVMLEDTAATNKLWTGTRQFYLSSTLGNPGLATMLTAISLGQSVFVRIAGTGTEGSLVTIIFLNAPP